MRFVIVVLLGMFILRKLGWALSKNGLYGTSNRVAIILCILWGVFVAFLLHSLIRWQNPNVWIKVIIGFGFGIYVSMPNFGLVSESVIPIGKIKRHQMIMNLPFLTFIASSIILSFL
jgi:hypothetical protein